MQCNNTWLFCLEVGGWKERTNFPPCCWVLEEMVQGFQWASSLWSAAHWLHQLPSVTCPSKRTLDLGPQLLWLVRATGSVVPKRPSGMMYQFTRSWGMCVQPTVSLAKIWLHDRAHPGTWQERLCTDQLMGKAAAHCFPQEGEQLCYEQLLMIRDAKVSSLECKMHQDCLYLLQTVRHWQLPITYYTNKSCGNGNWYKFSLFKQILTSYASVLLLGVSSDLVETACTFFPKTGSCFFQGYESYFAILLLWSSVEEIQCAVCGVQKWRYKSLMLKCIKLSL